MKYSLHLVVVVLFLTIGKVLSRVEVLKVDSSLANIPSTELAACFFHEKFRLKCYQPVEETYDVFKINVGNALYEKWDEKENVWKKKVLIKMRSSCLEANDYVYLDDAKKGDYAVLMPSNDGGRWLIYEFDTNNKKGDISTTSQISLDIQRTWTSLRKGEEIDLPACESDDLPSVYITYPGYRWENPSLSCKVESVVGSEKIPPIIKSTKIYKCFFYEDLRLKCYKSLREDVQFKGYATLEELDGNVWKVKAFIKFSISCAYANINVRPGEEGSLAVRTSEDGTMWDIYSSSYTKTHSLPTDKDQPPIRWRRFSSGTETQNKDCMIHPIQVEDDV